MKNKKTKSKPQTIGRPAAWLYHPAFLVVSLYYRIRYRVHIHNSELKAMPKGGCVVLATHTSNKDHFLTAMALYPRRVTFVMSEHFFANKLLRPLLRIMRAIHRMLVCTPCATGDLELVCCMVLTEVNHTLVYCISTSEVEEELVGSIMSPSVV